jgi:membrane-bound lytic murein transglycosylase B
MTALRLIRKTGGKRLKIWGYIGIATVLMVTYAGINTDLFGIILNSLKTRPACAEVTPIVENDEFIQAQTQEMYADSIQDSLQIADHYKEILTQTLTEEGWDSSYINMIRMYLMDPRAEFKLVVLNKNSTHQETKEQYDQYLTKQSVDVCMDFWKSSREDVVTAIGAYDVPPEIVVAILKVESNFGSHKGRQAVFNVFISLSIADNPEIMNDAITTEGTDAEQQRKRLHKRAKWGRSELNQLVNLVIDLNDENLLWEVSSWAGAFGLPQFIPSSFRAYARDGNNDGVIDLNNINDASISIANYLKSNGWKKGAGVSNKKKVIMRYNNSIHYAECILSLADYIRLRIDEE